MSIFELVQEKRTERINIHDYEWSEEGFVDINVRIPAHLKTPFEADLKSNDYKEWFNHCMAIQFFKNGSWEEAKQLFLRYRENQKKIKIRIFKRSPLRPQAS